MQSRRALEDVYPLTPMQEGMLFHTLLSPHSGAYLEQLTCALKAPLDPKALREAWRSMVLRHAVLRTRFAWKAVERPLQVVEARAALPWQEMDWRESPGEEQARFEAFLDQERRRGFELREAPLFRIALVRTRDDLHRFVFTFHHLLLDGWSLPILLQEVARSYALLAQNEEPTLPPIPPYRDYFAWLENQDPLAPERFWRTYLQGLEAPTPLGIDRSQPSGDEAYFTRDIAFSPAVADALRAFAQRHLLTPNTLMQGVWAILLSRYSGEREVVFGATVSGRPTDLPGAEAMVGMFINTLPLRVAVPFQSPMLPWLKSLQRENAQLRQYEYASLVQIQGWSQVPRGVPLFRSILVFENYPVDASLREPGGPLNVSDVRFFDHTHYPLTVVVKPGPPLSVAFSYDQRSFSKESIERLAGHFARLLESALADEAALVGELSMVGPEERRQLLDAREPAPVTAAQRTVVERFEEQAARAPDAIAVLFEDTRLTYAELDARANRLARRLRAAGVGPEHLVGLVAERSPSLVVGVLGILKAGGAYLPLDPAYPRERLAFLLEDARVPVVVGDPRRSAEFSSARSRWVALDEEGGGFEESATHNPLGLPRLESLAYVIYTSGSTGRPKGVPVQHSQIARLLEQTHSWFEFSSGDVWTLFHSYAFDFSVWELWGCLTNGGTLVIVPQDLTRNLRDFYRLLCDHGVTVLNLTPSAFKALALAEEELPDDLHSRLRLSWVIFGGEALDLPSLAPWFRRHGDGSPRLVNMYGITETTVHVTYRPLSERDLEQPFASPIGRSIPDLQVLVLDDRLQLAPLGAPGEIFVGGAGVSRGYLGRPALTAERFLPNPFAGAPGERLYRSGDRARRVSRDDLEFLGRTDRQVKVRGFRVELGEIEATLAQHPAIREAVVVAQEGPQGGGRLVAYYVATRELAATALRSFLRESLPEYMVPSGLVALPAIPLTANGKVDRASLPALEGGRLGLHAAFAAPRSPVEEVLASLWSQLLGVEKVGIHDSFFELGGHSLLATQVASRIRATFHIELPLRAVFEHFTVAGLAEQIERERRGGRDAPIAPAPREHDLPLSFSQQRLWFLSRLDPQSAAYNLPAAVRMRGTLDALALQRALSEVVRRHESLRTTFPEVDGRGVQRVGPALEVPMAWEDLTCEPAEARERLMLERATREARAPFDLATGPLLRARLLKVAEDDHLALLTLHHIVSDGWSTAVLVRELAALYEAFVCHKPSPLTPLPIQLGDFAHWQRQWLAGPRLEEQLSYWKQKLAGAPALDLPTDWPRPAVQTFNGASHRFALSADLAAKLRHLCSAHGSTLFMGLLAGFKILLHRLTGQTDLCVGCPIANRNRAELEGLIGFLVNTLVLRTDLSGNPTFLELLGRIRDTALGAYAHQDLPFERLVDELAPARDVSRTPLFQVAFGLQNTPVAALKLSGMTLSPVAIQSASSKFDLTLDVTESEGALQCTFEFNTDLFTRTTIERFAGHLETVLRSAADGPQARIGDLAILRADEHEHQVITWNRTSRGIPGDKTVLDLFEEQVEQAPDAPAVAAHDQILTYGELNSRAEGLAHRLLRWATGPEPIVAILLERSVSFVIAQLAVLKMGAAYLPLDPVYPSARLRLLLRDSRAQVLLTHRARLESLALESSLASLCLDDDFAALEPQRPAPLMRPAPQNLAYVIYTSGSTGTPKAVGVEHRALMRLVAWHASAYSTGRRTRASQLAGPAFDAAAWELWPALASGARIDIVPDEVRASPPRLLEWLAQHRITIAFAPTALADSLVRQPMPRDLALRVLLTGGDKLQRGVPTGLPFAVVNHYGPTESAVVATCARVDEEPLRLEPSIGRPIDNTRAYVLDRQLQLLPIGAAGELCIGGAGLARGYLLQPRLTAERFIPDPLGAEPGARLYRTGDRVRYRADGSLEFLGRLDRQVKVRGYRVELGEVEAALLLHPSLREAVVLAREDREGDRRLVAYLVANPTPSVGELRAFLSAKLPEPMIPSAFISLAAMPLTANGKVDRDALPAPDGARPALDVGFVAPFTERQKVLASLWSDLLGVDQVGVHDNFFELGGDSILSIQLMARARQKGLTLAPRQIFEHQTLGALASAIDSAPVIQAEQGPVTGPVPLTPIQAWFFDQRLPSPHHFNQSLLLEVAAGFRAELLQPCFDLLVAHHDALRLRAHRAGFGPLLDISVNEACDSVEIVDLSPLVEAERRAAMEARADALQRSLDLERGPIVRAAYFGHGRDAPGRLLIVIHHLAIDGVSWRILLEDLKRLYDALIAGEPAALPPKTTSFKHWAELLREYSGSGALRRELPYWASLSGSPPSPIPVDDSSASNTFGSARHVFVGLDPVETRALLEAPATYRANVNDLLVTALALALSHWAKSDRLLLDLEGHGREALFPDVDLSRTVGWFTSLYPVAIDLENRRGFGEALKAVKEQLRSIPNKGLGYGLLRYLSSESDLTAQPLSPSIGFNYLGQARSFGPFHLASEGAGPERDPSGARSHLLEVTAVVKDGCLFVTWAYGEQVHRAKTLEHLAQSFLSQLRGLIAHCHSAEAGGCTPADFPLARLDQASLDLRFGNRRDIEDVYPLTPMQQGMLFHTLLEPESGAYFEQFTCTIHPPFDAGLFERSWRQMLDRHPILRSGFLWEGLDQPLQVVYKHLHAPVSHLDWRNCSEAQERERFEALLESERQKGLILTEAPLVRLTLIRRANDTYAFVCAFHHLLLDGWSLSLALQDLFSRYRALSQGTELSTPPAPPFRAYLEWLASRDSSASERFWKQELEGFDTPTPLGIERSAPRGSNGHAERQVALSPSATSELREFAQKQRLTLNTVVQGLWAILVSRYSGSDDVVFGATVAGRPAELPGAESMVGLFINTVPFRARISPKSPFSSWLTGLQGKSASLREHEHTPLVRIQALSELPSGVALFNHIFVFENYPVDTSLRDSGLLSVSDVKLIEHTNYPITVAAQPGEQFRITVSFDRARVDGLAVERLLAHFLCLLQSALSAPNALIGELEHLPPFERDTLLRQWNSTQTPYPRDRTLIDLFEDQAASSPNATAIVLGESRLAYTELNALANRLARHLQALGAGPERLVGLCAERSLEMVVGVLGILKAGAAYVPLDPTYPKDRLASMLEDARISALVAQRPLLESLPPHSVPVVFLGEAGPQDLESPNDFPRVAAPENLAYVIFTSGSTGRPKGVELAHRGLCNLITAQAAAFGLGPADRVLQVASLSFDASVWEMAMALARGAALHLLPRATLLSVQDLAEAIRSQKITAATFPPSLLNALPLEMAGGLETLIAAGEACAQELARRWAPGRRFFNAYGPSESTVCATIHLCGEDEPSAPPIGRPIANTQVYVLDAHLRPVATGVAGELFVGGEGVARGYLRRPALTAERFIPNPFGDGSGRRLYRTGDRVRHLADGSLEFLGRMDQQVKVRGFRVEIGEVESELSNLGAVSEAVVLALRDGSGETRLVAYYASSEEAPVGELRDGLRRRLPEHMIPSAFVRVAALPRSPNGKVNRHALPALDGQRPDLGVACVAPRTPTEEVVAGIWSQVLRVKQIGVHDNFFHLGGHSLLATQVASRVREAFQVQLPLRELFEARTVEELAKRIDIAKTLGAAERDSIAPLPRTLQRLRPSLELVKDATDAAGERGS